MIIGNGVDIIEIDRIKKAIDRWGDHFIHHIFNKEEIEYVEKFKFPAQHYAVRFAAKEAVYKAVGDDPSLTWKDLTITNDQNGKPICQINRPDFQHKIHLSLSHSKYYAVANAIITSE